METIPKIKICGITNIEDGVAIAKLNPEYIGFIINYPKSPRNVHPEKAEVIITEIKKLSEKIKFVGVFVDQPPGDVKEIVKMCGLDIAQLHGNEGIEEIKEIKKVCIVWKSIIVKEKSDLENSNIYRSVADKILFDAGKGSGKQIDLKILENGKIDILAGGIGVATINNMLKKRNLEIVDANSKLESSPGKKDIKLVEQFIKKVRDKKHI